MKFMLMMNGPRNSYEIFGSLSKDELRAHIAFMRDLSKYLRDSGEYVATDGLADPRQAKRVKAAPDGRPINMDIEVREVLAGVPKEYL